jgi:hypothetical protein
LVGENGPGYPQARILEINLFIPFHQNSAGSKRPTWRSPAFAACADSYSLFSFSGFYRACRVANVMLSFLLLFLISKIEKLIHPLFA